ncbi:MAG: type II toxin-antitoxin system VapC family toxin [Thermoanaerobaculia bacterium]
MPVKVVDASVIAAIVFGEPDAERAATLIGNAELVAPPLLRFEVTNTAWKKIKRHVKQADLIVAGLRLALELDIDYVDVDHEAVLDLAVEKGMTAYDASYLWLSRTLKAPLVTLDERLSAGHAR